MNTIISKITGNNSKDYKIYEEASRILKEGGLVAFPTETVYGLGADALDTKAAQKVYSAKGRPSDNPLIVHIAKEEDLYRLSSEVTEEALKLSKEFWPGPLTMILKKKDIVPDTITGGLQTVAIRMPSHPVAHQLIKQSGIYIAAPSANTSGKPSPTLAQHVIEDLNGKVDMIIEDDTVEIGIESTIIDLSEGVPTILRPGYITKEMLDKVLDNVVIDKAIIDGASVNAVPKAPGMKYKHYAPQADLTIVEGSEATVINTINKLVKEKLEAGFKVGIMATDETCDKYEYGIVRSVGLRQNEETIARHLYAILREFDELKVDYIYSEGFSRNNVGQAIMNRLIKAAGHNIIRA